MDAEIEFQPSALSFQPSENAKGYAFTTRQSQFIFTAHG
jgi:hypothetical protein